MKFRAKKQGDKNWWTDFFVSDDLSEVHATGEKYDVEEDDIILNQSTGREDENGDEIFEDDMLEGGYKVVWSEDRCGWVKEDISGNQYELDGDELITGNAWDKEA